MTLYLTQDDVKSVLDMKSTLEAVESAFKEMGNDNIEMPARVYLHFDKGVLIAMPAYMPGLGAAGTKLVTVHPGNKPAYGLPAVIARIVLNSPDNGLPLAIMDGTYVTALRTGAAGATGIKYLSRKDSNHISAIGADTGAKRELMTNVITRCDKLIVDFIPQAFVVGDFKVPKDEGVISENDIYAELGKVVAGHKAGRTSPDEITLFKATGLAIQDVGTAYKVYQLAKEKGIGATLAG
jgi:ornithine cyclodeaminase/alanine dehydrogenase-like protein (mu-crystallin family)